MQRLLIKIRMGECFIIRQRTGIVGTFLERKEWLSFKSLKSLQGRKGMQKENL